MNTNSKYSQTHLNYSNLGSSESITNQISFHIVLTLTALFYVESFEKWGGNVVSSKNLADQEHHLE